MATTAIDLAIKALQDNNRAELVKQVNNVRGEVCLMELLEDRRRCGWSIEEAVGQAIFGKVGRFLSGLWIATMTDDEALMFNAAQYNRWAKATNRKPRPVNLDLVKFKDLGMVTRLEPKNPPAAAQWYTRCNSPLWDLFLMADVCIAELTNDTDEPSKRKFYVPSGARVDRMVGELVKIHEQTDPEGPRPARPEAPAVNERERGPNGELRCSKCKCWKEEDEFSLRTDRKWLRKSHCKSCMAQTARRRYLTVEKVEALNAVGLTFKLVGNDDVIGLTCVDCGQPFVAGDVVHSDGRLRHARHDRTG